MRHTKQDGSQGGRGICCSSIGAACKHSIGRVTPSGLLQVQLLRMVCLDLQDEVQQRQSHELALKGGSRIQRPQQQVLEPCEESGLPVYACTCTCISIISRSAETCREMRSKLIMHVHECQLASLGN